MRAAPRIQRGVTAGSGDTRTIPAIGPDGRRYPIEKMEAHRHGLLHDAISVFIFDGDELLLQRRAAGKYHCPGLWANACCTHPDWGEDHAASAHRRLREELGVDIALEEVGETTYRADVGGGLIEHECVKVFRAEADKTALRFTLNPDEVEAVRWVSLEALRDEARTAPGTLTPWLRIYLERWATLGVAA